jgi:hypothetical protein
VALTKYINRSSIRVREVSLPDMTHVTKEEKLGIFKGVQARLRMYWDIIKMLRSNNINKQIK